MLLGEADNTEIKGALEHLIEGARAIAAYCRLDVGEGVHRQQAYESVKELLADSAVQRQVGP